MVKKQAIDFISFERDTFMINPADIPLPSKNKFMTTDKIDAKNIAKHLGAGIHKKIIIPDLKREILRSLTRQPTALVHNFRRVKSRIKSIRLYVQVENLYCMDSQIFNL